MRLCYRPTALAIQVTDDGPVIEPALGEPGSHQLGNGGHGLTGMAERAAAVGGKLTAGPRSGGGFEVSASLPVTGAAQ